MRKTGRNVVSALTGLLLIVTMLFACIACGSSGKEIKSIEITTPPTKTDYIKGEKFDPAGMVISLIYKEEGAEKEVLPSDSYQISPDASTPLDTNNRTVTVTYEKDGKKYTAKQVITVHNNATAVTIKSQPTKTEYMAGEKFDPTGMVVNATFEDGTTAEVEITSSNAQYKTDPLSDADSEFVIKYSGFEIKLQLTIATGVFIEAENANINAKSYQTNTDSEKASGGAYIGNMFAGDSITFKFIAESAGKADIAFILSSVYLKEGTGDGGWTPVEMGDCQFNKIVEFTVNGTKYNIPDSAVLPGGVAADKTAGDQTLWFNWKEVTFKDVDLKAGSNAIKLTFIEHDYVSSQSGWTGTFGANIDCLRVNSSVKCSQQTYDITVTDSYVEKSGDNVMLNISGTAVGYDQSDISVTFGSGATLPLSEYALDESKGTFTAKVALSGLSAGQYTSILVVTRDTSVPLKTTKDGGEFSDSVSSYTVSKSESGLLTIEVVGGSMYKVTKVELKEIDGKPCYVITGEVAGYTSDLFSLDMQENNTWAGNNPAFTMEINTSAKTFTVAVDLSSLKASENVYIPHFKLATESGDGAGDIKVANGVEATIGQSITVGSMVYTLDDSAFSCVCVKIVSTKNYENKSVSLETKDNKAYLVINGTYSQYEKDELTAELTKSIYADTQNMPKVDGDESSESWDDNTKVVLTLNDTLLVEVYDDGTYKIYLDLSAGQNGQALFSHFNFNGATNSNLANLPHKEGTPESITVGNQKYSFVDMSSMSTMGDAWSWATTLIVVKVEAAN